MIFYLLEMLNCIKITPKQGCVDIELNGSLLYIKYVTLRNSFHYIHTIISVRIIDRHIIKLLTKIINLWSGELLINRDLIDELTTILSSKENLITNHIIDYHKINEVVKFSGIRNSIIDTGCNTITINGYKYNISQTFTYAILLKKLNTKDNRDIIYNIIGDSLSRLLN